MMSKPAKTSRRSIVLASIALIFAGSGAMAIKTALLASGTDTDLILVREAHSEATPETLTKAIQNTSNWPDWHSSLEKARIIDIRGLDFPASMQQIQRGSVVRLSFAPDRQESRKFDLLLEVSEFLPSRGFEVRILEDRHGKISGLFDQLRWKIEFLPREGKPGTTIRATVTGHTAGAKARILAGFFPGMLWSEVLYADFEKLAAITQPHGVILIPESQR